MKLVLCSIVLLVVMPYLVNQVRKPDRWTGGFILWIMNASHSGLTDWGLKHVTIGKGFTILDVGCGGGRTIQKLAAMVTEGMISGVDYAAGSVAASRSKNARFVQAGRVEIKHAAVSRLPFADGMFDLVTAVETQYYWPDLAADMREILRVLKPGGRLIVIAESYRNGKHDKLQQPVMKLLRSACLSVREQQELFSTAGYKDVQTFEEPERGWICAIGVKAS